MTTARDHPDRHERVKALLEIVLALPPLERPGELQREAPEDPDLHREVLELARASERADAAFLAPLVHRPAESMVLGGLVSDRVGPYRIVRLLGRGAMGAVYEAVQDAPISRRVAIKVLSTHLDPAIVARRFAFERDALARLDHPGIAKILDAGVAQAGHPFLVMELVDGMPLTEYCAAKRLSVIDRLRLVVSIAEAVHYAHSRGILHRDLKPQNILVTQSSGSPVAKIIDFGIARLLVTQPGDLASGTVAGQVFGTPGYMAPEQVTPQRSSADVRADVFALGVVLHELLTGVLPSEQGTRVPPSRARARGALPLDVGSLRGSIGELDCIVLKSIEADRELRYPSAQHLADDLHRLIAGLPVSARPPSALYVARKFAHRHRVSVVLGVAAISMLLVATVMTSIGLVRARRDRDALARLQASTEAARQEASALGGILESILCSVDPARDGPDVPLRSVLDRTADDALAGTSASPATQARLRLALARTYESLGQFPRALELLAPSVAAQAVLPQDLVLDLLIARARCEVGMSRPEVALEALDQAASLAHNAQHADRSWAIEVNRANALQLLGRLEEARQIYESLRAKAQSSPTLVPTLDLARVLINSGVLLHQLGERDAGEARVLAGRDLVVAAHGNDHPLAITAEHNDAVLRMARGDTNGAIDRFNAVITQWTRVAGPSHTNTLNARLQLADLYRRASRLDEAGAILAELPAQLDAALGPDHTLAIGAVQSQAQLAAARSDWPLAIERMQECVRRYESRRGDADPNTWYARAMLVDYQRRGAADIGPMTDDPASRAWRAELDRLLTEAESRFGESNRYVRAIRRLRDAVP